MRALVAVLVVLAVASSAWAAVPAASIAGFPVSVTCDMQQQAPPYDRAWGVYHGAAAEPSIQLRPFVCDYLDQAERGVVTRNSAGAVFVLGHELAHSFGVENETGADCVGGTLVEWVARKLHVTRAARGGLWAETAAIRDQSCAAWGEQGYPRAP